MSIFNILSMTLLKSPKIRVLKAAKVFNDPGAYIETQACPGGGKGSICLMELTLKKGVVCYTSLIHR